MDPSWTGAGYFLEEIDLCILCAEWQKGKMTMSEFSRNIREMAQTANPEELAHYQELSDRVKDEYIENLLAEDEE
jgi:hypothetical protein